MYICFLKCLLVKFSFKPFFIFITNIWGDWITFLKNLYFLLACSTAKIAIPLSANAVYSWLLTSSSSLFLVSFCLYNMKVEKKACVFHLLSSSNRPLWTIQNIPMTGKDDWLRLGFKSAAQSEITCVVFVPT